MTGSTDRSSAATPVLKTGRTSGRADRIAAVAVVLHGGTEWSQAPTSPRQPSVLRMLPIVWCLRRRGRKHGLAVWALRFAVRGWNGDEMSPMADVRWALEQVRSRHGDVPVALVGHSMGGRAALRGGGGQVRSVVAHAPWLPAGEPVDQLARCSVLIAHGNEDRRTSPGRSREFAHEAAAVAAHVSWVEVRGSGHALLRRARHWHRLTTDFVLGSFGFAPLAPASRDQIV